MSRNSVRFAANGQTNLMPQWSRLGMSRNSRVRPRARALGAPRLNGAGSG